jgi:hypothetical protein
MKNKKIPQSKNGSDATRAGARTDNLLKHLH